MELHQLESFLAVADELHFGRAAERLHMAQPPLSRMIKQLERELGAELFERTTRRVRLTSAGEALIGPAKDVLEGVRVVKRSVAAAGRGETGRVRLGFAGPSSHVLVGQLSRMVREQHPGIEVSLKSSTYNYEALRSLLDGQLDLAIARWRIEPEGVEFRAIGAERYVVAVPRDHRLAGADEVTIAELRDEPFIVLPAEPGSSVRDALVEMAKEAGFMPRIAQTAPDSWTIMALVAAGVGITLTLDTAVKNMVRDGICVVSLVDGATVFQHLVWRQGDTSPALKAVLSSAEMVLPSPE